MKPRGLLLLAVAVFPLAGVAQRCKCLSFQSCWPSPSEFSELSSQLSQPLIHPTPPASACYPPSNPSGNCTDVISHLPDGRSFTFDNGTIDACYYDFTLGFPCDQGNIPIIGVDARTIADVQAAVGFVSKHDLRLVVKNTGHDYLGRSTARGAFMLWTHNLKNITYDDIFVLSGNSQTYKAFTLGAGVQWYEAYAAANDRKRVIVGGVSVGGSVGASGGWIQGGGHSILSSRYGLGVDNVIQFTYQNQDLFWALRGGGGGTYGIVLSVTYRTYDVLPVTGMRMFVNFSSLSIAQNVSTEFFAMLPSLLDAGWSGYSNLTQTSFTTLNVASNVSVAEANATFSMFIDRVRAVVGNPQDILVQVQSFSSFYEAYLAFYSGTGEVGGITEMVSRLLSSKMARDQPEVVAKTVLSIVGGVRLSFVAGGAVSKVDPDSSGLNPAWREAVALVITGISWEEGTTSFQINRLRQSAAANLDVLDRVSVDSGTYFNEASLYEKDFKKTFFGSHYPRLKDIKRKYDQGDIFLVAEGVGSDDWDKSLNCRLD
ncbi:hypothetical protein JOM56_008122 [Amanita muscaria]